MKALKKFYYLPASLFIIFFLFFSSCYGPHVVGDGNVVEETREVSDFNKLEISGAFRVFLTQGNNESLKLVADENLHEYIKTRVINNRLIIESTIKILKAKKRHLYIQVKSLEDINLSGAIKLESKSAITAEKLKIEAGGAVEIDLDVRANQIRGEFSGACETRLRGSADKVFIHASGGVKIRTYDLTANRFDLKLSGAGIAGIYAKEQLNVDITGAASVRYKGDPVIRKNTKGASSLRKY
ncbi:head GIN domain-containing protein [Bacteroidota bacterium]